MKAKTKKQKGYLHRLIAAQQRHPELFQPGTLVIPRIRHEVGCGSGIRKECNCHPDITLSTPRGTYQVRHDGRCVNLN